MSCSPTVPLTARERRQFNLLQSVGRFDPVYSAWCQCRQAENTDLYRRNRKTQLKPDSYCQFLIEHVREPAFARILANKERVDLAAWAKANKKKWKKSFAQIRKYEKLVRNVETVEDIEFIDGKNLIAWQTAISYGYREMLSPAEVVNLYVGYLKRLEARNALPEGEMWINNRFVPELHEFYRWKKMWGEPLQSPYLYFYDRKTENWLHDCVA